MKRLLLPFYVDLVAAMIVITSYLSRRKRDHAADCARYMQADYPFDMVEMKIDKYLEGLLNG